MKKIFVTGAVLMSLFAVSSIAFAQTEGGSNPGSGTEGGSSGATGTWTPGSTNVNIQLKNPLKADNLLQLLKTIVNDIILPIGAVIAVLAFIFSGFKYVTAQGNETKVKDATRALLYTAIGTAVLLGAWVIFGVIERTINQLKS